MSPPIEFHGAHAEVCTQKQEPDLWVTSLWIRLFSSLFQHVSFVSWDSHSRAIHHCCCESACVKSPAVPILKDPNYRRGLGRGREKLKKHFWGLTCSWVVEHVLSVCEARSLMPSSMLVHMHTHIHTNRCTLTYTCTHTHTHNYFCFPLKSYITLG